MVRAPTWASAAMKTNDRHLWRAVATHAASTVEAGGLASVATLASAAWIAIALPALHVENAFGVERNGTAGIALEAALLGIRTSPGAGTPPARKEPAFLLDPKARQVLAAIP